MEIADNGFIFSDDKSKIDVAAVHLFLSNKSYWAEGIPLETVTKSIENSLCFGIYKDNQQTGFARWITDRSTFAYLADVYVEEEFRGMGLSKKLMSLMLFHPDLQGLRRYMLATRDAHSLYSQYGFQPLDAPENIFGCYDQRHL
ncbi:GNAT family N-acetyltransferase [Pedobacter sp. NJ-S-72]